MRAVAGAITLATALLAADVGAAAVPAADPYRPPGSLVFEKKCTTTEIAGRLCTTAWVLTGSAVRSGRTVRTVRYRIVWASARAVPASVRKRFVAQKRAWVASQLDQPGLVVVEPVRFRWAEEWRVLLVDTTTART
jgi:hypothetical protein